MAGNTFVPAIARLSSRVILVLGCNPGPMTLQGTNTYLIGTGRSLNNLKVNSVCRGMFTSPTTVPLQHQWTARRILLDSSDANIPQYIKNLKQVLQEEACDIEHLVVSHWHHDHIGGVPDVLKITTPNCTVWKHQQIDEQGNIVPSDIPFNKLNDGQILSTEGASLRILHTPGHTTDHVVLVLEEDGELFSGDTILGEGTAVFEDLRDYMNSLRIIQNAKPKVIYPGHGPIIKVPDEVITFYINHRQSREEEIMHVLRNSNNKPISAADIVKSIYLDLDTKLLLAAENNVIKHLIKLKKENKVCQSDHLWQINSHSQL